MTEEFPYEVLFRWAFPEWKGDVPPLVCHASENLVDEQEQTEPTEPEPMKLPGKWFIWEVIANNYSNLSMDGKGEVAEYPLTIDFIRVHCFAPHKLVSRVVTIDRVIPEFEETAAHFLPNAAWVFAIDQHFLESLNVWDPVIAQWMQNTEIFSKTQRIEPLSLIVKDGKLFETFISLYESSQKNQWIYDIEMVHLRILGGMHNASFSLDVDGIRQAKDSLSRELSSLEKEIYQLSGREFNILSPLEVSDVLFNSMQIPNPETTESSYSVDSRHRVFAEHQKHKSARKIPRSAHGH